MKHRRTGKLEVHWLFACVHHIDGKQGHECGVHKTAGIPERIRDLPEQQGIGIHEEIKDEDGGNADAQVLHAGPAEGSRVSPDLLDQRQAQK